MTTERIDSIKAFAFERHKEQKYGDRPYSAHLEEVDAVIRKFSADFTEQEFAVLVECSWLHDIIEDTGTTAAQLESMFGSVVADTVYKVSDEPGKNRKERKAKTYPKIASSDLAIALKLADRIANVENCRKNNSSLFGMYVREHEEFREQLFNGRFASMWLHLDCLVSPEYITK